MAVAEDRQLVLTGCSSSHDGGSRLFQWDATTQATVCEPVQYVSTLLSVAINSNQKWFATGLEDGSVKIFHTRSASAIGEFNLKKPVFSLCWLNDSEFVFAATANGLYSLSPESDKPPKPFFKTKREKWLHLSPDGKRLAAWGGLTVDIINVATSELTCSLPHRLKVVAAVWTPDGHLLTASDDCYIREWDTKNGGLVSELFRAPGWIWDLQCTRDAQRILVGTENTGHSSAAKPGEARIWNRKTGEPDSESFEHPLHVLRARFSSDERFVVTASIDKTAAIWDVQSNRKITEFQHPGTVYEAYFQKGEQQVITRACEFVFGWPFDPAR